MIASKWTGILDYTEIILVPDLGQITITRIIKLNGNWRASEAS